MDKKVLHIINSKGRGGAEVILRQVLENRKSDIYFCLRDVENGQFLVDNKYCYGTKTKYYKHNPIIFFKLFEFIKNEKPKIIHVWLAMSLLYIYFIKIFFPSIKVIYHEHGEIQYNTGFKFLFRFLVKKIDFCIAVSNTIKLKLLESGAHKENTYVIVNPVDLNRFNINKNNHQNNNKEFIVGFAGRITKIKGWRDFVSAALIITNSEKDIKFIIAGDGEEKEDLMSLIKQKDLILYKGYVSNIKEFYNEIDLFVLSSYFEAMPNVILESMVSDVPVLCSNIDSVKDIVRDNENGFLYEKGNINDLVSKILLIKKEKEKRETVVLRAHKEINMYSLDIYLEKIENIYSEILSM